MLVEIEVLFIEYVLVCMDMFLGIVKSGDCYKVSLEYNMDLFDVAIVVVMLE